MATKKNQYGNEIFGSLSISWWKQFCEYNLFNINLIVQKSFQALNIQYQQKWNRSVSFTIDHDFKRKSVKIEPLIRVRMIWNLVLIILPDFWALLYFRIFLFLQIWTTLCHVYRNWKLNGKITFSSRNTIIFHIISATSMIFGFRGSCVTKHV